MSGMYLEGSTWTLPRPFDERCQQSSATCVETAVEVEFVWYTIAGEVFYLHVNKNSGTRNSYDYSDDYFKYRWLDHL